MHRSSTVHLLTDGPYQLLNNITDFHIEHDEENPDTYTVSAVSSLDLLVTSYMS